jgi:hypothetical protein
MGNNLGRRYDQGEVHRALTMIALTAGNCAEASRRLKRADEPLNVPSSTLKYWRGQQHTSTYESIREELQGRLRGILAAQAEDNARTAGELEADIMDRLKKEVAAGKPADVATIARAVREMATTKGINTDKALVLRGQPNVIEEKRSASEILNALQRKFPQGVIDEPVIDSTAEEITEPLLGSAA